MQMAFCYIYNAMKNKNEPNKVELNWKMILIFIVVFLIVSQVLSNWDDLKEMLLSSF